MEMTRYMNQEEKETAKVLFANGSTIFQIAQAMRRSSHAIKRCLAPEEVQLEIQDIKERLIRKYQEIAERCTDRLLEPGTLDQSSPRDLATISGISVDKSRLLSGQSTENVAIALNSLSEDEIDAELARLSERLHGVVDITPQ